MNKFISFFLIILALCAVFTFSGCSFFSGIFGKSITISADSINSRDFGINSKAYQIQTMTTEEYFKSDRIAASRGNLLYKLTPERFILDIDIIVLYNNVFNEFSTTELLARATNPDGGLIPQHFDLAYSDDFVRDVSILASSFDGISMQFLPDGNGSSNDGFYVRSITGIALPSVYDGIVFEDNNGTNIELTDLDGMPTNLRFFGFNSLQPYDVGDGFLSYLTLGNDFETAGIQNPEGLVGDWDIPVTETNGNSVQLFFPLTEKIDFRPYSNPEIIFNWDLVNLVEIYDAGTPGDYTDDIITYRLDNPFPVSMTIQENTGAGTSVAGDTTPPSNVLAPAISGPTTWNTLQWINPIDEDFSHIVIVRKAGSAPTSRTDGEEVYNSYKPNYVDTTGTSGTHYYYRVYTVDTAGNYSDGFILDQVQP